MSTLASIVLLAVLVAIALPASPAAAHTELAGSTPVPGAPVSIALDRVVLTFTEDLLPGASAVVVTGPSGEDVTSSAAGTAGATLEVGVAMREPGRHEVAYRVVGQDGHVVTGSLWFTAITGDAPRADDAVSRVPVPGASVRVDASGAGVDGSAVLLVGVGGLGLLGLLVGSLRLAGTRAAARR